MDVFLWIAGTFLMIVPCVNMGLLSDYKICGDPECASLMSRVQAIKDHHGKDCRFLSFRRGDTIFVYYKLTGRREDLWAGSIDRQFGYFPNDAVQEEQVYSTTEKVVETQESDFLCMDEFGYPIDTTDLDSDNDDEFQKSETVQVHPNTQDTEGPQTSQDRSTESIDEAQKSEENKMLSDAAEPQEDAHKTPATQKEQGGSPSSSWLGSSVTGWLGLSTEEQSGNLREGVNELKEPKAEASLTSSVTDWLGFREETKPDTKDILKRKDDSISSTMTGWLGFGGEKKTEQNQEVKTEPTEMFRSRRMSLDLESDELNKEKKEMGTLDWLGSGLSSRLGFRQTNQDPGKETQEGEEEKEQSSSWIDVGIGGILGLSNDNDASDISKESVTKETENDKTLEQAAEHVDKSGSQVSLTDEFMAESSTESLEPTHITSTEPVRDDSKNYNIDEATDASGRERSNILDVEAGLKVDHKDVSPPAVTDMSSTTNNLFQSGGEDNNMLDDNNKVHENMYVEVEVKVPRMPDSMGNMNETNTDSLEENKTVSYDEDLKHLPDSSLDPNLSSGETNSNTTKQSEDRADEDEKDQIQSEILGSAEQEEAEDTNTVHHEEKYSLVKRSARGEEEPFDEATDLSVREVLTAQTEEPGRRVRDAEGSNEQRQVLDERREHVPDEEHLTPPKAETNEDNLNTPAITDGGVETEIHQDEEQPVERSSQELTSLHSGGKLTEGLNNNVLEEDRGMILTNITYKSQTPEFLQSPSDAEKLKETLRNQNEETKIDTLVFKEEVFHVSNLKTSVPETDKSEDGRKEKSTAIKDRSKEKKEQEGTKEAKEVGNNKQQEEADNLNKKEEKRVDGKFKEEEEKVEDSEEDPEREMTGEGGVESEKERAQELEELKREEELPEQEDQVRLAGLKESEETKEKPTEEKQEQERQLENVQSDAASPDSSDDNSFTENITMSESQRMGWQEGEPAENLDKTVENQQKKVAEDVNQMFSHDSKEATEDGRSSDDGRRSTAAAPARSGVQGEDKTRDIQVKVASNNAISDASEDTMKKTDATTDGSEPHHDGGIEPSTQTYDSDESQAQASEQALLVESERGGAFGFSFQTPTSTQSSLTTSTTASQPQTSFSPKQESESTAVPLQDQETHPVPPTELPHPTPTTETSPKATPLPKHYRSLLMHMSGDELDGLLELLGRHKLQFLDYILSGSEEAPAAEDQSILSDIERLLFHHMEKLVAPSMKLTDAPQEDKDKTQLLIALQKLETLLKTIKDSFSTGMSDVSKHPDELSCATCSAQDEEQKQIWQYSSGAETILRDEQIPEERSWNVRNDQTDSSVIKEEEQQERGNKEQVDEGAPQKGFQEQILDFIHGMNEDFNWSFFTQLHVQVGTEWRT